MRHVLFITYEFPPSLEVGAQACSQLTRHLPLYGWEPVVLTVRKHHYSNTDVHCHGEHAGRIVRTWVIPHPLDLWARLKSKLRLSENRLETTYSESSAANIGDTRRMLLSLLKVPDVHTGWILPGIHAGLKEIRRRKVDHLCSSAPYWSNHLVAMVLSQLTGLSWTAHFRDPWTGIPQWKLESPLTKRIESALERRVVTRATRVVCVTEPHTELLRQTYPALPSNKFATIPNGFDEAEWGDVRFKISGEGSAPREKFVIRYAGSLYQRRNPLPLFRAVRTLVDSSSLRPESVVIELIGWCDEAEGRSVRQMADECGIASSVTFTGPLPRTETLRRVGRADLLLLLAEDQPYQIPGKTYEYLRAGRPILALTRDGALSQLLRKTGGACVVDPADEEGIATTIWETYCRWSNGQEAPKADWAQVATFDRRLLAGRLAEVFNSTCTPSDDLKARLQASHK